MSGTNLHCFLQINYLFFSFDLSSSSDFGCVLLHFWSHLLFFQLINYSSSWANDPTQIGWVLLFLQIPSIPAPERKSLVS